MSHAAQGATAQVLRLWTGGSAGRIGAVGALRLIAGQSPGAGLMQSDVQELVHGAAGDPLLVIEIQQQLQEPFETQQVAVDPHEIHLRPQLPQLSIRIN